MEEQFAGAARGDWLAVVQMVAIAAVRSWILYHCPKLAFSSHVRKRKPFGLVVV